jgi:predicted amino acid racemase
MTTPYVGIDLDKIEHNARTITGLCQARGIRVTGVTKGACGHPDVAQAMLRGGVSNIGDSRLENIRRMRDAGVDAHFTLLRLPASSQAGEVVEAVDMSLNSELDTLAQLSQAAQARGEVHEVIIMVDLGDLREGLMPADVVAVVTEACNLPGIVVRGLGTNLNCFAGLVPTSDNMNQLASLAAEVRQTCAIPLDVVSGLNSGGLDLIKEGDIPVGINHARIGEAILLGRETIRREPWPDTHQDAFVLHAELLELRNKPSQPSGERGQDAFGGMPDFEDRGEMPRALLNLGRADVDVAGIAPIDSRMTILGASSGYLALDVSAVDTSLRIGDEVAFSLNYSALLAVMSSEYVEKRSLNTAAPVRDRR